MWSPVAQYHNGERAGGPKGPAQHEARACSSGLTPSGAPASPQPSPSNAANGLYTVVSALAAATGSLSRRRSARAQCSSLCVCTQETRDGDHASKRPSQSNCLDSGSIPTRGGEQAKWSRCLLYGPTHTYRGEGRVPSGPQDSLASDCSGPGPLWPHWPGRREQTRGVDSRRTAQSTARTPPQCQCQCHETGGGPPTATHTICSTSCARSIM